jgi:hypothetical protein
MGGGLMQLVAYGAQDIYLTGNPQITFFKVVYRRHTNFSMETIEQTINGASTTAGGSGTVTISRNGDLVHKVYVSSSTASIEDGDEIVAEVEIEIGGQRIDRHFKEWNQIWNELTTTESKAVGLKSMKGCVGSSGTTGVGTVYVPLNFWFCRNPGLALPLIALQYHEVKLKFTWGDGAADVGATAACKVWCDYIYLDTDERRRFAQVSHEYLIEQLQSQSATAGTSSKLNFNHPVKELIWTSNATNSYLTAQLKLNGHDRFAEQDEEYFQLRQPYDYHTAVPRQNLPTGLRIADDSEVITKTCAVQTAAAGINDQVCDPTNINLITLNGDTNAVTAAPANGSVIITAAAAIATGMIIGGVTATSCIKNNSLKQGDLLRFDFIGLAECEAGAGDCFGSAVTRVNFICAQALQTVAAAKGTAGPLASNFTAFDNHTMDTAQSDGVDDASILVLFETALTFPKIPATGEDQVVITRLSSSGSRTSKMTKKINVYSFGLKPEEHQPSGTCNFSRIDNAQLDTGAALVATDTIYAVNYNVLRIMSGMGGLAYSN